MIKLPFPPSTNRLWRSVNGRAIKSKAYRAWEQRAGFRLSCESRTEEPAVNAAYHLEITLERPDKRKRDLDNCVKCISDLLVAHGITPDDSLMQSLTVRWADAQDGPTVKVLAA